MPRHRSSLTRIVQAVIHEKVNLKFVTGGAWSYNKFQFGDGIMSMINCKVHVDKKEDPAGDRVVLTFE